MRDPIISKVVVAITVFVIAAAFVPPAAAQCTSAKLFASAGSGPGDTVRIDPGSAENAGNEIGRFWQSSNSALGSNSNGGCPSHNGDAGWWRLNAGGKLRIEGWISASQTDGTMCVPGSCPAGDLTVIVEEKSVGGDDALFIGFRVDETPPAFRWWDFSRVDPAPSPSVLQFLPFPALEPLSSSSLGGGRSASSC